MKNCTFSFFIYFYSWNHSLAGCITIWKVFCLTFYKKNVSKLRKGRTGVEIFDHRWEEYDSGNLPEQCTKYLGHILVKVLCVPSRNFVCFVTTWKWNHYFRYISYSRKLREVISVKRYYVPRSLVMHKGFWLSTDSQAERNTALPKE